jgi:hypothetical protein
MLEKLVYICMEIPHGWWRSVVELFTEFTLRWLPEQTTVNVPNSMYTNRAQSIE